MLFWVILMHCLRITFLRGQIMRIWSYNNLSKTDKDKEKNKWNGLKAYVTSLKWITLDVWVFFTAFHRFIFSPPSILRFLTAMFTDGSVLWVITEAPWLLPHQKKSCFQVQRSSLPLSKPRLQPSLLWHRDCTSACVARTFSHKISRTDLLNRRLKSSRNTAEEGWGCC